MSAPTATLGQYIRAQRASRSWTAATLARFINRDKSEMSRLERDKSGLTLETAHLLAQVFAADRHHFAYDDARRPTGLRTDLDAVEDNTDRAYCDYLGQLTRHAIRTHGLDRRGRGSSRSSKVESDENVAATPA